MTDKGFPKIVYIGSYAAAGLSHTGDKLER